MEFTNSTQIQFEPGKSESFDLGAEGVAYSTPEHLRPKIGDLARLSYLRAVLAVDIVADAAANAVATVELMAGETVVDSAEIDMGGTDRNGLAKEVDLSAVPGAAPVWLRVTVSAGDAGKSGALRAWLMVNHPLIISNC